MSRLVIDADLQAEVLRVVQLAHRSRRAARRICDYGGGCGGGRLGDCLIIQVFSKLRKLQSLKEGSSVEITYEAGRLD